MKSKLLAATIVALIPLSGFAAEGKSGSFDTLDSNRDGRISMPEASADPKLVENFSAADKNGDGYLDNAEYDNARTKSKSKD